MVVFVVNIQSSLMKITHKNFDTAKILATTYIDPLSLHFEWSLCTRGMQQVVTGFIVIRNYQYSMIPNG